MDGYSGFLYLDKDGMPEVAMHWQHRFNHAVQRYNDIYRVQMPNITPHVCRHTYCSNMAKAGMNPKTLQYLMGHSDIGVTMNTYTHLGLEDAKDEMIRTRKIPMTEDVYSCFQGILEDRETPTVEKIVDGYSGFLFLDKEGLPEVAMHWEHRFNHMVKRYNEIYRVQLPNITPHVCRHTYCSNMARVGMNPKTLQYLMGHSDIGVTMNTYTHLGLEDAQNEMVRLEELNRAKEEVAKAAGEKKPLTQRSFRAV